jgi:hypothetical protein
MVKSVKTHPATRHEINIAVGNDILKPVLLEYKIPVLLREFTKPDF